MEIHMTDDPRCCGTGTCIINDEGLCWCGQKWDGEKMCFSPADNTNSEKPIESDVSKTMD
ncbi:MAG: hypothetical protein EBS66_01630 [Betaproteobacteria bacterium]|nr:hypothetical protein [Betaproteobacteria bacterium]NBY07357.1 hypothetical protein [Betaproteobacteria bacterium]